VSTLPAAASLLFGVVTGFLIVGQPGRRLAAAMAIAGAVLLAVGLAMDALFMPINKNLWTPTYAVFMAGWSLVTLALFRALLDESQPPLRDRARAACLPLIIFGMNALFLFAFSGLVGRLIGAVKVAPGVTLKGWLYGPLGSSGLAPENASLVFAILFELAMFAVAWLMWKKRWFIRA
jgi:predicted acyltransferase